MIAEIAIALILTGVGLAVLSAFGHDASYSLVWLAFPTGTAVYLLTVPILVVATGTLNPALALGSTAILGVAALVATLLHSNWDRQRLERSAIALGVAVIVVILSRRIHVARLTFDSLTYLLFSIDLQFPDALEKINQVALIRRHIGFPSLHSLSSLTDARYLASMAPLFGLSLSGLFMWFSWRFTAGFTTRRRVLLVTAAMLFLLASSRYVYASFYVNSHIQVAAFLLITLVGAWIAVSHGVDGWELPVALSLGTLLVLRPEGPVVVAIVLAVVAASKATWRLRCFLAVSAAAFLIPWYGIILWQYSEFAGDTSLTSPVIAGILGVLAGVGVVLGGGYSPLRPVTRYADRAMVVLMAVGLTAFGLREPEILVATARATVRNVQQGMWGYTWVVAVVLFLLAVVIHRVPDWRMWTMSIWGFGLLYWLLPYLRESAYRPGQGDSGNRILIHFIAVVVAFLVLAAVDPEPDPVEASTSRTGLPVS